MKEKKLFCSINVQLILLICLRIHRAFADFSKPREQTVMVYNRPRWECRPDAWIKHNVDATKEYYRACMTTLAKKKTEVAY